MTRGSIVLFAVVLAARGAAAQPATPVTPNPAADAALAEGRRLYDLQEWDQAIVKFKEAYRLRDDAPALFNIAQSYRLKKDCANAANFYKVFKRKFPAEKNIDKVSKFIVEMEACAATQPAKIDPVKTDPVKVDPVKVDPVKVDPVKVDPVKVDPVKVDPVKTDPVKTDPVVTPPVGGVTTTVPPPPSRSPGASMRLAGIVVGGVGAISIGAGVVFGLQARGAASDAEALAPGSVWKPGLEDRGESAERKAKIFLVVGGVAIATGAVLFTLGAKKNKEATSVTLVPQRDGATMAWGTTF